MTRDAATGLDPDEEVVLRVVLEKDYQGELIGELTHLKGEEIQRAFPEMSSLLTFDNFDRGGHYQ